MKRGANDRVVMSGPAVEELERGSSKDLRWAECPVRTEHYECERLRRFKLRAASCELRWPRDDNGRDEP